MGSKLKFGFKREKKAIDLRERKFVNPKNKKNVYENFDKARMMKLIEINKK